MNTPLNQDEIKALAALLTRALDSRQMLIVDQVNAEFEMKSLMRCDLRAKFNANKLRLAIRWTGKGELPEVAGIAARRVSMGLPAYPSFPGTKISRTGGR